MQVVLVDLWRKQWTFSFHGTNRFKQIGMSEGKTLTTVEQEWNDLIRQPSSGAIRARDQWRVPVFEGVRRAKRKAWLHQHTAKKLKDLDNVQSFTDVRQASAESLNKFLLSAESLKQQELFDLPMLENLAVVPTGQQHPLEDVLFGNVDEEASSFLSCSASAVKIRHLVSMMLILSVHLCFFSV